MTSEITINWILFLFDLIPFENVDARKQLVRAIDFCYMKDMLTNPKIGKEFQQTNFIKCVRFLKRRQRTYTLF